MIIFVFCFVFLQNRRKVMLRKDLEIVNLKEVWNSLGSFGIATKKRRKE